MLTKLDLLELFELPDIWVIPDGVDTLEFTTLEFPEDVPAATLLRFDPDKPETWAELFVGVTFEAFDDTCVDALDTGVPYEHKLHLPSRNMIGFVVYCLLQLQLAANTYS